METSEEHEDAHIPEDKVIYRKTKEGKTIAINPKTGQVSGCGPETDNQSEKSISKSKGESQPDEPRPVDNNPNTIMVVNMARGEKIRKRKCFDKW